MKKGWRKILGAFGIIIVLFMSIAILMDLHVPAKLPEKNEGENVQRYTYKKGIGEDHLVLLTALAASKGSLEYTNITIWGQSIGENYSLDDMEDIVLDCARLLGLEEGSIIENFQEEYYNQVKLINQDNEDITVTIVMDDFKSNNFQKESYLLVDLFLLKDYKNILELENIILDYFVATGFSFEYDITVGGSFSNKMNTVIMKDVINKTFNSIGGEIQEGMEVFEEGDLLSYTGYSPKLADAIQLAGERVNLNIAMKSSDDLNKAFIWIGTPLIATDY